MRRMLSRTPSSAGWRPTGRRFACPRRSRAARPRFDMPRERGMEIAEAFFAASRSGDMTALGALLAADVTLHADGGGKVSAAAHPLIGFDEVLKVQTGLARYFAEHMSRVI